MSEDTGTVSRPVPITPSDTVISRKPSDGIQVNGSGDVKMDFESGNSVTMYLLAGVSYPYRVAHVYDTDTDATGIHLLYFS